MQITDIIEPMKKWLRDTVLIPVLITIICSFLFMLWGAWYTGVKLHSPFSQQWLKTVFSAPVQLWFVLIMSGMSILIGFLGYASKRKFDELLKKNESLKQRWEPEVRQHDDRLFREGIGILPDNVLIEILDSLQTDDSYLSSESRQLRAFTYFFSQVGNQYLDSMLSVKVVDFKSALNQLLAFLGGNFFVYPEHQSGNDLKLCMYPRLNDDRDGDGKLESALKYRAFEEQLDCLVREVRRTHNDYRLAAKNYLYV
jgi:hypothetical protein